MSICSPIFDNGRTLLLEAQVHTPSHFLSLLPLIPHTPSISTSYWIYPKICPNFNHGSLSNYYCTRPSSRHLLRGCYHCLLNDLPDSL